MWRTILLGKLGISILASIVVGIVCVTRPLRPNGLSWSQSMQWVGIGSFFLLLAVVQVSVIYILTKKKK